MSRPPLPLLSLLLASACTLAQAAELPAIKPGWVSLDEPKVERAVIEDDSVRIEELRVRGQTQKVVVHHKGSKAPSYEILMGDASHELSPGAGSTRGVIGKRVWRVLDF